MNIDRLDFEAMITFMDPVISNDRGLSVRVENDSVICTAGNANLAKKAVLTKHSEIEELTGSKELPPQEFMITNSALLCFKKLMGEHKSLCKKLAKGDPSYLYIDISDKKLWSNKEYVIYEQPSGRFENLEPLFEQEKEPIDGLFLYPSEISSIMTGFEKSKQIKTSFCGETVHFYQESSKYEAFFVPSDEEEKPPLLGEDE
jgi:hypothetical protein